MINHISAPSKAGMPELLLHFSGGRIACWDSNVGKTVRKWVFFSIWLVACLLIRYNRHMIDWRPSVGSVWTTCSCARLIVFTCQPPRSSLHMVGQKGKHDHEKPSIVTLVFPEPGFSWTPVPDTIFGGVSAQFLPSSLDGSTSEDHSYLGEISHDILKWCVLNTISLNLDRR